MLEGLIGPLLIAYGSIQLPQQVPLTCFLLTAHFMHYHLLHIRYGLLKLPRMYIIVGVSVIPFLYGTPVQRVALHVSDYVFSVIYPAFLHIAFGQPCTCFAVYGGLCAKQSAHVSEGRGSLIKLSFKKLRPAHEHPSLPNEGVILSA